MDTNTSGTTNGRVETTHVDFSVLGPTAAHEGGNSLPIGGQKQRSVLAMFIAHAGRPVSNDLLAEAVYGEAGTDRGRRRVQTYVSTLRSVVGDAIVKDGTGWYLAVDRAQVDALRFEDLYESVRDASALDPETVSLVLRDALGLWRGHPYSDIDAHGLLDAEIARLSELRVSAQAARIDANLALGRDSDLIGEIEALLVEHPYQERFRSQHMTALYRAGRQKEALRSYNTMRRLLIEEIGVDPTPDLQELERRILEQDPGLEHGPPRSIQRRALLVADAGDPLEMARMPPSERDDLLRRCSEILEAATEKASGTQLHLAGTASYAVFENIGQALEAAGSAARASGTNAMRIALDWGDVELTDEGVSGPPVSRAAVLLAVAHRGQVLLSAPAQEELMRGGGGIGTRFEALGTYDLVGIGESIPIYQVLVGDPPAQFPPLVTDRTPPPLPGRGDRSIPGYELRDPVAQGSVGMLHTAYQPSVGREVLIEVIGRSESSDPDFIRNFEADAQRLALLDHPNISPLIDYWRHLDGAFLVYRHHRGGFLGGSTAINAARIIDQIGTALDYAHSLGVVHGSVRPDRVALDESGNAYLLGFPVGGVPAHSNPDYASYIAPETLAGSIPTVATDVFALGVLAHELLSGEGASADSPIVAESKVIAKAMADNPRDRMDSVAEFLIDLNPIGVESPRARFSESRNPYKGLTAFHESDSGDFHGREAVTAELIAALEHSHLLSVVGPSGIGKSSVVRAGLIPALRNGALPGSEDMVITDMLPGSHPFLELQRALERVAVDLPAAIRERLVDHDADALAKVEESLPEGSELLLIIDQFEELFTMTDPSTTAEFLDLLVSTVNGHRSRVVITLRADFLGRPLLHSSFGELMRQSMVTVRSPNVSEMTHAITRPARAVGVVVDPAVAHRMAAEVHDRPGALPLLQHALVEIFDARKSNEIDMELYESMGGVTGSLARRAETIYDALGADQQGAIEQVFLRLLTIAEDAAPTRQRIRLASLDDLDARQGVDAFARSRLLVFDNDPDTRTPTVEVAHEALLTEWPRLAGWIDDSREDLTLSRRLREAVREWESNHEDKAYLLTGGRLAQHQAWTAGSTMVLTEVERDFLDESTKRDDHVKARSRRRVRRTMTGFATAAVIASVLGVLALVSADRANDSARVAEAETLAANSVAALDVDPELAVLLAVEAIDVSPSASSVAAAHKGIQHNRSEMIIPVPEGSDGAWGIIHPTEDRVAVMGVESSTLQMWEVGASEFTWEVTLAVDESSTFKFFSHIWFSEDGTLLYVPLSSNFDEGGPEDGVYTIDAMSGSTVAFLPFPCLLRVTPAGTRFASEGGLFAFDGTGTVGGSCAPDARAGVINVQTGEILFETPPIRPGRPPSLSADGAVLSVSAWFPVDDDWNLATRIYDTETGNVILDREEVGGSLLSGDGTRALLGESPIYLYDLESGERLQTYQGTFSRISFSPDEELVIGSSPAGATVVFDTESGAELTRLRGHETGNWTSSVNLDGSKLVTSSFDSARVWNIVSSAHGELPPMQLEPMTQSRFLPGGLSRSTEYVLVRRGAFNLFSLEGQRPHRVDLLEIDGEEMVRQDDVWHAELSPGGLLFEQPIIERDVTTPTGETGAVLVGAPILIDPASGEIIAELEGCSWYWIRLSQPAEPGPDCGASGPLDYTWVSFTPDGSTIIATTAQQATTIWDAKTGRVERESGIRLAWEDATPLRWPSILLSDAESFISVPVELGQQLWPVLSTSSGSEVANIEMADELTELLLDESSGLIIGASSSLLVVDPDSWVVNTLERSQGSSLTDVAVSPDGLLAATVGTDESVVVWDLQRLSIVDEINIDGEIGEGLRGIVFLDNSTILVAPETGDVLLKFTLDADTLHRVALDGLNRGFRPEECTTYGIDPCPTLEEMRQAG